MKKIAIMQPYFFPYLGYFSLIKSVDQHVIYDDVQFIKGGWINRNYVLINRQKSLFSIRLSKAGANRLINEIEIIDDFLKFQKMLRMAYGKAPYKKPVLDLVARICAYQNKNLAAFVGNSLREIVAYLNIRSPLVFSSLIKKGNAKTAQDKVIAICRELQATIYINSIGGQSLYDGASFSRQGIELQFIQAKPVTYMQFGKAFVPNLSIIDALMFNSVENVRAMLDAFELINANASCALPN
jgi:hypothetical protein